ncbi:hypothetical protein EJB05_35786, partial [Eragrostis curvula]
ATQSAVVQCGCARGCVAAAGSARPSGVQRHIGWQRCGRVKETVGPSSPSAREQREEDGGPSCGESSTQLSRSAHPPCLIAIRAPAIRIESFVLPRSRPLDQASGADEIDPIRFASGGFVVSFVR